jgi:uncharacterized repeat protein (TIGR01451 family)
MKKLFPLLLLFTGIVNAQNVTIPDANLKNALVNVLCVDADNDYLPDFDADSDNDGEISVSEAQSVVRLHITGQNISDLSGLEAFTNLTLLNCQNNQITGLDLTGFALLEWVEIDNNPITSLNTTGMMQLGFVGASRTAIPAFDFTSNNVVTLRASNCPLLTSINGNGGHINFIDFLNTNNLQYFNLHNCSFGDTPYLSAMLGNQTQLQYVDLAGIDLASLIIRGPITYLDISTATSLTDLMVFGDLTNIDVTPFTNLQSLVVTGNNLSSLNLSGLTQLNYLDCSQNQLTSIDLSSNPNIRTLYCGGNALTSLNISGMPNLLELYCFNNNISSLNLSQNLALQFLVCDNNALTNLDVTANTALTDLYYSNNNIANIDLINNTALTTLGCNGNGVSTLNLSANTNLFQLNCAANNISTLDLSTNLGLNWLYCESNSLSNLNLTALSNLSRLQCGNNNLTTIDLTQNPNLSMVDCTNNPFVTLDVAANTQLGQLLCGGSTLTSIDMKNGRNETLTLADSPNLQFVCVDESQVVNVQTVADLHATAAVVNSYCNFIPGGDYNTVSGNIRFDDNADGCDASDTFTPYYVRLDAVGGNTVSTASNQQGNYAFYLGTGSYTVTPHLEYPSLFTISPESFTVNFADLNADEVVQNFCFARNGNHPDLEIVLAPIVRARPGFDAKYKIIYRNKGNLTQSGAITLTFDDAHTDFVSATPSIDNQGANTLVWNFTNLHPFESRAIEFTVNVNAPGEIPAVNGGDYLDFISAVTIDEGEETPPDNGFSLHQIVVNAFDPNDKTCLEGAALLPENIGKYLHYNINFENTGTAEATNIVVKDEIDTSRFDTNSLQLIYASHTVYTRITGNKVEFIFENINLPPSSMDPIGGHGNVLFKIKTLPTLAVGDEVANTANIFFDYNAPIDTNEARTAFNNLSKTNFTKDNSVTVYPNPAKNKVTVKAAGAIKSVQLYDVQGRILHTAIEDKNQVTLDLSNQQRGVYFLTVTTQKGSSTQKIIKE